MNRDTRVPKGGDLAAAAPEPLADGVAGQSFSSSTMTVHRYWFDPGARGTTHRHPEEQITIVEAGSVDLTVEGRSRRMHAGAWIVVEPDSEHGLVAGEEGARLLCIVSPARTGDASPLSSNLP